MIISHKHKFIFIKPQKVAGTSVELLLSRICGDGDVITPLGFDPNPNVRTDFKAKDPMNYFRLKEFKTWDMRDFYHLVTKGNLPNRNYWEHLNASGIKDLVGDTIWESYTKISIVRNPWDRACSWYKWQQKYNYEGAKNKSFSQYIMENYRSAWPFYSTNNGLFDLDVVLRFETLSDDIENLKSDFPELAHFELPHTKGNIRAEKEYHKYYTPELQEVVALKSAATIKKFGYHY